VENRDRTSLLYSNRPLQVLIIKLDIYKFVKQLILINPLIPFRERMMFNGTPGTFQGEDNAFWDTLNVYFRERIIFIGTKCIFQEGDYVYLVTLYITEKGFMFNRTPFYFKEATMLIETPCIFQGGDPFYWHNLYISGWRPCLLGHPVYFRE